MKIKSIRYAGKEPVYDMYVDKYHNFITQGGTILHNCDALRYWCITHARIPAEPDRRTEEQKMIDRYKAEVFGKKKKRRR